MARIGRGMAGRLSGQTVSKTIAYGGGRAAWATVQPVAITQTILPPTPSDLPMTMPAESMLAPLAPLAPVGPLTEAVQELHRQHPTSPNDVGIVR